MKKLDVAARFEHLHAVIRSDSFLRMEALGGEIPFFITTYPPEQEYEVREAIRLLARKLTLEGVPVQELNLYDLSMELLRQQLGPEGVFEMERDMDKPAFREALDSLLDIREVILPWLRDFVDAQGDRVKVWFLTGVGQVYPFLRSHNILNNLQSVIRESPTLMFFPGVYTGQSLELFGMLKDDNYYRAFNLDNYKI